MDQPNADQFIQKAKQAVIKAEEGIHPFRADELYIVWFCKVLGNWKALISTDAYVGAYWEVTYNGAKLQTYVDTYAKERNVAISDQILEGAK